MDVWLRYDGSLFICEESGKKQFIVLVLMDEGVKTHKVDKPQKVLVLGLVGSSRKRNITPRFRTSSINKVQPPTYKRSITLPATKMAPSFDNLTEDNGTYDSEEELDFSGTKNSTTLSHGPILLISLLARSQRPI